MKNFPLYLIFLGVISAFVACVRDDDEPAAPNRVISRLYVSTSDYDGTGTRYSNLFVIDPVDSSAFPSESSGQIRGVNSGAKGGAFVNFTPFGGLVFQGSQNYENFLDTAVQVMTVSDKGVVATGAGRIPNRLFNGVRGLSYTIVNEGVGTSFRFLLMLNSSNVTAGVGSVESLYVIERPENQRNYTVPRFHMSLDYNPWGIYVSDRDVYVSSFSSASKSKSPNGIIVYKNLTSKFVANTIESELTDYARFDLTIAGAENIRGISYSKVKDIMVLTDVSPSNVGRIFVFENFSQHSKSATISPTRTITSSSLKMPMDIAIDPRANAKYMYVTDAGSKKVLRFNIEDSGDVSPNASVGLFGLTPVSLSLDAR